MIYIFPDPYAWLLTLPLALGLLWADSLPSEHKIKQFWNDVRMLEEQVNKQLFPALHRPGKAAAQNRWLFWFAVTGFTFCSMLSLAAYLGILMTP